MAEERKKERKKDTFAFDVKDFTGRAGDARAR